MDDCLKDDSPLPTAFKAIIKKTFDKAYGKYEDIVLKIMNLTGAYLDSESVFQNEKLLKKLPDHKKRVKEKTAAATVAATAAPAAATSGPPDTSAAATASGAAATSDESSVP